MAAPTYCATVLIVVVVVAFVAFVAIHYSLFLSLRICVVFTYL